MRDGPVILDVDIEPFRVEVLCHHHAGLDDAALLGEVCLAESLIMGIGQQESLTKHSNQKVFDIQSR